jgi:DNA-binding NtrC family response regulator
MTPLETILITTPQVMHLQKVKKRIGSLRRGIRELVRARVPMKAAMAEMERQYVAAAIAEASGNRTDAALMIGTHRNTILRHAPNPKPWMARKPPQGTTSVVPESKSAKGGAA